METSRNLPTCDVCSPGRPCVMHQNEDMEPAPDRLIDELGADADVNAGTPAVDPWDRELTAEEVKWMHDQNDNLANALRELEAAIASEPEHEPAADRRERASARNEHTDGRVEGVDR